MITPELIQIRLNAEQPQQRLTAARILGMVEETRALETVRERFHRETYPSVKTALDWTGQRLHTARRMGYHTFDELFRRYHLEQPPQPNIVFAHRHQSLQAETLQKFVFGKELHHSDQTTLERWANYWQQTNRLDEPLFRRAPKPPSTRSPQTWLNRYQMAGAAEKKIQIIHALVALNNPVSLIGLSDLYFAERDARLQQEIADSAKSIYLNFVYWDMARRGILEEAIQLCLNNLEECGLAI